MNDTRTLTELTDVKSRPVATLRPVWSGRLLAALLVLAGVWPGAACDRAPSEQQPVPSTTHEEALRWADEQLPTLSLERKVAQLITEQVRGEFVAEDDPQFQHWLTLVGDHGIGGLVVYGGTPVGTAQLLNRLQEASALPLLISADFEGGPGQQLAGATEFPPNMALSAIGSDELAYQLGQAGASEGRAVGIHLTYSPVVDIQTNPQNPVLGGRSFGRDLDLLGRMSAAYIKGYQDNGMLATAKHYPGRGDVELIAGTEFTINRKPKDQVVAEDFEAFRRAISAGVTFVMSEHIAVPSLTDGSDLPASVNKTLASHWLRDQLGFTGVLTTDDMWYPKVTDRFGPVKANIMALQAGHDMILKPADAVATIAGIVEAVKRGEIPEAQIDASAKKVLYWKARLNLQRSRTVDLSGVARAVGVKAHRDLARRIADASLTLLTNSGFFPSTSDKVGSVVHISLQRREGDLAPAAVQAKLAAAFPVDQSVFLGPNTDPALRARALEAAAGADTVIISLFSQRTVYQDNGSLSGPDVAFINRIAALKPQSTVVMSYGNPYLAESAAGATAFVTGYGEGGFYGNQLIYADSFISLLKGEITPRGKLPVMVSPRFAGGAGLTY